MKRGLLTAVLVTSLLSAAANCQTFAQVLPEPTADENFQNDVLPAPTNDVPLLNPASQSQPAVEPQSVNPASRTESGPGYLGVTFDTQIGNSAAVLRVLPGSPAELAGLQPGDMIESLQGRAIKGYQDVLDTVATMRSGDKLDVEFSRRVNLRTQAALQSLPDASRRSVGYAPNSTIINSQTGPNTEHELLPTPASAHSVARPAQPRANFNPAPQNQNSAGGERRNRDQNSGQFDGGGLFRGRGLRRR